ncbi:MAG: ATP/GTP-binding protein [Synechococcus sp.]
MIRAFEFKNFSCFKEGGFLNFKFDGSVPNDVSNGSDTTKVLGLKGANGSGKTTVIKALSFLASFCHQSADYEIDSEIPFRNFSTSEEPTEFYIEIKSEETLYFYELTLDATRVIRESIYRKKDRKIPVLVRDYDEISSSLNSLSELKKIKIKSNSSIISIVSRYKFESKMEDLKKLFDFFSSVITNVGLQGYSNISFDRSMISKLYSKDSELFSFVKKMMICSDEGIDDVKISSRIDESGETIFFPVFHHSSSGEKFYLRLFEESSGTQTLFEHMLMYWFALEKGRLLAIDEFDIHIHAMILPKIIELFLNPETNPNSAQLIFTAHNTEIIESLTKYRTVLVNKEDGESYCYRLDEISGTLIRHGRPITPTYLSGRIGGVPPLRSLFCSV